MKSFYYLHVPKAAGRAFFKYILKDLVENTELNKRYLFPESNDITYTHHGWHNLISEDTYLICSLRDPVEAIISYRMHHGGLKDKGHLFNTINEISNLQSKSFLSWSDNKADPEKDVALDREIILSRLKRIDLLIDSKKLDSSAVNAIRSKIASDLGAKNIQYASIYEDSDEFKTNGVKEFCDSLTKEEIDIIKEVNYMDVELYEAAKSLFFPI
jgi:hypothetical protein